MDVGRLANRLDGLHGAFLTGTFGLADEHRAPAADADAASANGGVRQSAAARA